MGRRTEGKTAQINCELLKNNFSISEITSDMLCLVNISVNLLKMYSDSFENGTATPVLYDPSKGFSGDFILSLVNFKSFLNTVSCSTCQLCSPLEKQEG